MVDTGGGRVDNRMKREQNKKKERPWGPITGFVVRTGHQMLKTAPEKKLDQGGRGVDKSRREVLRNP